ncbi:hypothetical protein HG531_001926 [Fusarium graminearum]|nr:hypothetical protein HG531_001926 [Fusarium graminearum]
MLGAGENASKPNAGEDDRIIALAHVDSNLFAILSPRTLDGWEGTLVVLGHGTDDVFGKSTSLGRCTDEDIRTNLFDDGEKIGIFVFPFGNIFDIHLLGLGDIFGLGGEKTRLVDQPKNCVLVAHVTFRRDSISNLVCDTETGTAGSKDHHAQVLELLVTGVKTGKDGG